MSICFFCFKERNIHQLANRKHVKTCVKDM